MPADGHSWEHFVERLDLSPVVPEVYADYRNPVIAALKLFLRLLPEERRREILIEQITLPTHSHVAERLFHLMRQCPTLHKLGQILSRHPPLPIELRSRLHSLESHPPLISVSQIHGPIERALRAADSAASGAIRVLAEGSVAVVVGCPFRQSADGEEFDAAIKILKPGIERRLEEDLAVWPTVTDFVVTELRRMGLHAPDVGDVFERVSQLLRREVDLSAERRNLEFALDEYGHASGIRIPRVFPGCTPEAVVMERMDGLKVSDAVEPGSTLARKLSDRIVESVLCRPMLTVGRPALFHGDPHAGNLLCGPRGELIILDWSLAERLVPSQLEQISQLLLGLMTLDTARITGAVSQLAIGGCIDHRLMEGVLRSVQRSVQGEWPGVKAVRKLLDDLVVQGGVSFPTNLLLFRKSLGLLEGVVHDLSGEDALEATVFQAMTTALGTELWGRWWSLPWDRNHPTHLSNADLWTAWFSLPASFGQRWAGGMTGRQKDCHSPR